MKRASLYLLILLFFTACGTGKRVNSKNLELVFLDDYIIPRNLEVEGTKVGGLSGIDFHNNKYLLVCDHPGNPRFYNAEIRIAEKKIDTVIISEVIELETSQGFLKNKTLDLEAIRFGINKKEIVITSEGSIMNGKDPAIFSVTPGGEFISSFTLPSYFKSSGEQHPRNNGVFEGLALSVDGSGYWVGMELPLKKDGSKPKLFPTKSPVRITHFNNSGIPTRQFVMQLEGITKIPWLYFAVNGLTELIEYAPNRFLVLERAFSAGHGSRGNTVRIFDVDARATTNTLDVENLRKVKFTAAKKTLVFDFKKTRKHLKEGILDNLEGMTFGPNLKNGNKTILLASDNNFNTLGEQINQIILMELNIKN